MTGPGPREPTDQDFIRSSLAGHADAYRTLVERYQGPVSAYLSGRLGGRGEVEEATQETFVRGFLGLAKLRKPESFPSWLLGIADRIVKEKRRLAQRDYATMEAATDRARTWPAPDPADDTDHALRQAVADLPQPYRQVILLRYYGGLSCAEIGQRLDMPLGSVTKQLSRAYALLREQLQPGRDAKAAPAELRAEVQQ